MNISQQIKTIELVTTKISQIVPNFCGVTMGGSRMHGFNDNNSDVELYFYSSNSNLKDCVPNESALNLLLYELGGKHKRSERFLWNEAPWGPHSFFLIDDLYFEIGYRSLVETKNKLEEYVLGLKVAPQRDCHDLGLGYMYSGFASSVQNERILFCKDNSIELLKTIANEFSPQLYEALKKEYYDTAVSLYKGKLFSATNRKDVFCFGVISNRIIRALMIMAFAKDKKHFPGDKWNEQLLKRSSWKNAQHFTELLKKAYCLDENKLERSYKYIGEALSILEDSEQA